MLMEDDRDDATWVEEIEEGQATSIDSVASAQSAIQRFSEHIGEKTLLPALQPIIAELRAGGTPQ